MAVLRPNQSRLGRLKNNQKTLTMNIIIGIIVVVVLAVGIWFFGMGNTPAISPSVSSSSPAAIDQSPSDQGNPGETASQTQPSSSVQTSPSVKEFTAYGKN